MIFPSPAFLWLFLPAVLALHTPLVRRSVPAANALLVGASLLFYIWGSGALVALIGVSVAIDHIAARIAAWGLATDRVGRVRVGLAISIIGNVGLLGWYKYAGFLGQAISDVSEALGAGSTTVPEVALPIGISFFTFQSMSYTFDVAAGRRAAFRSPLELLLYVSLFPQLIAGPIVRVSDIGDRLRRRTVGMVDLADGFARFAWGLAKKVIIADSVAPLVDAAFDADPTTASALIAAVGFAVQIYFDFSGYSDMAIGIGRMLGFVFPENFLRPYEASTVTDFWRRWHVTLSSWFRDYVYIPLGGSRHGIAQTYRNLILVFLLTGLWHGAAFTFVVWGAWHGAALLVERHWGLSATSSSVGLRVWTMAVVLSGWVLFRAPDLRTAGHILRAAIVPTMGLPGTVSAAITPLSAAALIVGALLSILPRRIDFTSLLLRPGATATSVRFALYGVLLPIAAIRIVGDSFSPFLYFRF